MDPEQTTGRALEQSRELLERSTAILAEAKQLQFSLEGLRAELSAHDRLLRDTLGRLQEERERWMKLLGGRDPSPVLAAVGAKEELPAPPWAFLDPQGLPFPWELPPAEKPAEPATGGPSMRRERRSFTRRVGNLTPVTLRSLDAARTASGWVLDHSLGGLGILVDGAAKTGDRFSVRPTTAPEQVPWVEIEVCHCQALGSSWRIGCRFVDLLSQEQVRLFS
jgi:hypothetical protein